ncbi:MAG: TolC family protein [Myxococcota bacterium]
MHAFLLVTALFIAEAAPAEPDLDQRLAALFVGPSGLTAASVAAKARDTGWEIRAAAHELEAARAGVTEALWAYVPRLSGSARYVRLSPLDPVSLGNLVTVGAGPAGPIAAGTELIRTPLAFPVLLNQTSFQLSLTVPLTDYLLRIGDAHDAAEAKEEAAAAGLEVARERTDAEAKLLYYGWLRARLAEVVAEQALDQAQKHAADASRLESAGSASHADTVASEARVAQAELLLLRVRDLSARLGDQLRLATHSPTLELSIGEDLTKEPPPGAESLGIEVLRKQAKSDRAELILLRAETRALLDRAAIASAQLLPRLDAFADAAIQNPSSRSFPQTDTFTGTWDLGIALSYAFTEVPAAFEERRAALAHAEASRARLASAEDGIDAEVLAAQIEAKEARAALSSTRRQLDAAEAAYAVRSSLFAAGMARSVELTDAEAALTQARLDHIDARIDLRVGHTKLARALGKSAAPN